MTGARGRPDGRSVAATALGVVALVLAVAVLAAGATGTAHAAPPSNVTGCTTIDSPGVYTLNASITNASGTSCINVTASDVVLDGQGNAVDGVDSAGTVGISVSNATTAISNVTVRNVTVTDWNRSVAVGVGGAGVSNATLRGVNASSNDVGIVVGAGSSNAAVVGVTAEANGESGVLVAGTGTVVNRSDLVGNQRGVEVNGSLGAADVRVANNTVSNNGCQGVLVIGGATGTVVTGNDLDDNGRIDGCSGIDVFGTAGTVVNNSITNSAVHGIYVSPGSDDTVLRNNTVTGIDSAGIRVDGADRVAVTDNVVDATGQGTGVSGLDVLGGAANATVRNNTVTDSGDNGIYVDGPDNRILNNTVASNPNNGIYLSSGSSNATVRGNGVEDNGNAGIRVDGPTDVVVADNAVASNECTGILVESGATGTVVRGNDLDDNGQVDGCSGVDLFGTTATVRNNSITNSGAHGVYVDAASDDSTVGHNTITGTDDAGIRVEGADRVAVTGNVVDATAQATGNSGLDVFMGADNATVRNNTVTDSGGNGIYVDGPDNRVVNNTVSNNPGDGIQLTSASSGAVVAGNDIDNNGDNGIIIDADNALVVNSTFANNTKAGIRVRGATNTTVRNATVRSNGLAVAVVSGASDTVFENLQVGASTNDVTVSFAAREVEIRAVESAPQTPAGEGVAGGLLNATNVSADAFLDVTFEYTDDDVATINESTLDVWRYDSDTGTWTELGGTLDTAANAISYNVTNFSVVGPLGELTQATVVDGGSPEDLSLGESVQNVTDARVEGIGASTIKLYYNVTPLADRNVNLGSLTVQNFTATNGTADQTNVNSNSGVTVVELTVTNISATATNVSFQLAQLGTGSATNDTGIRYAVNVSEGTSSDSRFDGSSGNAPDADDPQSGPFAIGVGSGQGNFRVTIESTNSPVPSGSTVEVVARINNTGPVAGNDTVSLRVRGSVQDTANVSLASGANTTVTLKWDTSVRTIGTFDATVATSDDSATTQVRSTAFFGISAAQDGCRGDAPGGDDPNDNGENGGCRNPY